MSFKGKIALITGGSRGIGKGVALELASLGTNIVFNYHRNHEAALETKLDIEKIGVQCLKVKADLSKSDKIRDLFRIIRNEFGHLDILVNNAASGIQRPAKELEEKHWDWVMNINAKAAWMCSIEASNLMSKGGNIINITSLGSQKVLKNYFSVGTSKAALESSTRYLAVELAPKGISVNAVSGGYVNTEALNHFPNRKEMLVSGKHNPVGRMLTAQDIAKTVSFLCTRDAEMIRGQVIVVDGGYSLI